jgi:hypothetical protein
VLGDWERRNGEESAVGRLSDQLVDLIRARANLGVLSVHGTGPSVRVNGLAVVDATRREALLIVGRITAITTDRRG